MPSCDHLGRHRRQPNSEQHRDRQHHERRHADVRSGGAEQQQAAGAERDHPRQRDQPMAGHERLGQEQRHPKHDQRRARPVDRHHREAEQRQHQAHGAERARQDHAGVEDLVGDAADAGQEQQEQDVGIDQDVQQLERQRHALVVDLGVCGVHHQVLGAAGAHAVDLVEQRRQVGGDAFHQVVGCGFIGRVAGGFPHGQLRGRGVAVVAGGQGADLCLRVVQDLAAQVGAEVLAAGVDRRGRADVGVWRHRRVVACHRHEHPCRGCPTALRRDVHDHRQRRGQLILDDVVHRVAVTAGRVQQDYQRRRVFVLGALDGVADEAGRDRVDLAVECDSDHVRAGVACAGARRRHRCSHQRQRHHPPESWSSHFRSI